MIFINRSKMYKLSYKIGLIEPGFEIAQTTTNINLRVYNPIFASILVEV